MNGGKTVEIHTETMKPCPVSLEEYRAVQQETGKRLDRIQVLLQELKASY